ncbi:MAG: DEAD/DEAH box helicase [Clostridia bacterium]|nr:DEAD/DEAH box helicase [Clostridia bacterium]MDD4375906.1 DEAD/DEAH box helicase [Clostridia bacterium]
MKFTELQINEKIKKGLSDIGFEEMMPIQEHTIQEILNGKNIIGEAETGTGKTAAFVIPMLNNIDFESKNTECIIVTPTRELAMQIVTEIKKIGKYLKPSYATLVGGMSIRDQVRDLNNKPAIVIGTLGRINDHLRNKKLDLKNVKYFVLDEADEMLKEGWKEDITTINNSIPTNKQTLLFSATISKQILSLSKSIMDDYKFISVKDKERTSTNIEQYYIIMKEKQKFQTLTKLLDVDTPKSAIIFGRTKRRVDELNEALNKCGYKSVGIHGDLSQQQRNAVMKKFRENQIKILVATDVAARGLDISNVTHVYNFDLPQEIEFYIHRVGRTGRAKKHGISYSFIKETELSHVKRIEKETNVKILEKSIPSSNEVFDARDKDVIKLINKRLEEIDITRTKDFATKLVNDFGSEKIASILIETLSKKSGVNKILLTGEPPVVVKKQNTNAKRNYRRQDNRNRRSNNNRTRNR